MPWSELSSRSSVMVWRTRRPDEARPRRASARRDRRRAGPAAVGARYGGRGGAAPTPGCSARSRSPGGSTVSTSCGWPVFGRCTCRRCTPA
jgi:hypothetical protein